MKIKMKEYIRGIEGIYKVKHRTKIYQYKIDSNGVKTGEYVIHVITDTIENDSDRKKINEYLQLTSKILSNKGL